MASRARLRASLTPSNRRAGATGLSIHSRQALAAAIIRLLTDHPLADMIGRAGHDVVHERFCIGLMVRAVEGIYDDGARAVRISGAVAS